MIMRILLLICLLVLPLQNGWSQDMIIDSLNQVLEVEKDPIQRIDLHLGLFRAYAFSQDKIQSEKNIDLALELSQKHQWEEATVAAYIFKGLAELNKGSGSGVLYDYIQKAMKLANEIDDKSGLAFANYHLAEYYIFDKNDPGKGLKILEHALENIDDTVPHKHIGNIYKTQGVAYGELGNKKEVLESYEKALFYFEKVRTEPAIVKELGRESAMDADGGQFNKGQILVYLATNYAQEREFEKAQEYIQNAISIYQSLQAADNEAWAKEIQSFVYEEKGDLSNAIASQQEAILVFEENQNLYRLIGAEIAVGELFFKAKNYENALKNFEKAIVNSETLKDTVYLINALGAKGRTMLYLDNEVGALKVLNRALEMNDNLGGGGERYELLANLAEVYEKKKDYPKAIGLVEESLVLNRKRNSFKDIQRNLTHLTKLYTENNQIKDALHYGGLALEHSEKHNSPDQDIALQKIIADLNEKTGNYKAALAHHKAYFKLFEKTYDERAQALLKNEQVRQDVAGAEAERKQAELTADLLASRNRLYIILAVGLGVVLLIGSYLFYQLRKTKQQLESQNIQLQQLNATKDKFFGIIAHDIRSPIVALDGVGNLMDFYLNKNKTDKLQRLASRVDKTAKQLSSLLDNLLNWALLQQGVIPYHPQPLNVKGIGEGIFQMFQQNADAKNIQLKLDIDDDLKVQADESALNTILRNLVSNAIKFTPEGGTVSLSTETKGEKIFININDTGTGISTKKLGQLFSLEKKTEKGTAGEKGTGLGLTLVKELVELNKGTIAVDSVIEKGSNFKLGLPMAA